MGAKHVVVTGGASGLGCVRQFRRRGWRVTIADIDLAAAQQAVAALGGAGALQAEPLDLAAPGSVAGFAQRMRARGEPIDVLFDNAGIYPPARRQLSPEGHELTFAIAHLGHFRLTHALWPLRGRRRRACGVDLEHGAAPRAARSRRSRLHATLRAYQHAKLACPLFALELQRRLSAGGSAITSYAAHPGVCRTQIGRHRRRSAQDNLWERFATLMLSGGLRYVGQSPDNGAASVITAATDAQLPPGGFVGPRWLFESFGPPAISRPGAAASDSALAAALWMRSDAITGLRWTI